MAENHREEVHLSEHFNVILKRKWTIITCLLVIMMVTAYATFTKKPMYQASAKLIIEKKQPNILNMADIIASSATSSKYYQTQYQIIQSRSLAKKVADKLDLYQSPEFNPEPQGDPISVAKRTVMGALTGAMEAVKHFIFPRSQADDSGTRLSIGLQKSLHQARKKVLEDFQERLSIEPIRETHMVLVKFEASSPALAAQIANAVGDAYLDYNLETKMEKVQQAVAWLKDRLQKERQKVKNAQNAFLEYRKKHNITTDISPQTEQIRAQRFSDLESQILEAETRRKKLESKYMLAEAYMERFDSLKALPGVLTNEVVQSIKQSELELSTKLSKLSGKYGENHPKIKAITFQFKDLRRRMKNEAQKIVEFMKHDYQTALAEEQALEKSLLKEKKKAMELNEIAIMYGVLKRKAQSAKKMYDLLVKRFKEASLTEEIKTVNARVVDRAQVPQNPIKPQKKRNMMLALVLGLGVGTGVSFFAEYMDNTFKTPEDVQRILDIPYLGTVPLMKSDRDFQPALVASQQPRSLYSEAYRGLRTNLLFSAADIPPKTLLVTSSGPCEGKSVTAMNLAITLAQAGTSTLILDCDMRKPSLHRLFRLDRDKGLSNVLTGSADLCHVQKEIPVENLTCIPSGPIPPNPSEILGSQRMQSVLASLAESYDRIIIDSPPVTAVADSAILASLADGVIMVIQGFETPYKVVQTGLSQLRNVRAKVLGAVLNGIDMQKEGAYYSYYSYYYYYSEEGKKKGKRRKS